MTAPFPSLTALDRVLDGLTVMATGQLSVDPGVQVPVYDGPVVDLAYDRDKLIVGVQDALAETPTRLAVTGEQVWSEIGRQGREETFVAYGCVVCWTGDLDQAMPWSPLRARAFTIVRQLAGLLRTDPSIGGAALESGITVAAVDQATDRNGRTVQVPWRVAGTAWLPT